MKNITKNLFKLINEQQNTIMFLFFVFIYLVFGFCFNFYNDEIVKVWNGISFGMDTGRVYESLTNVKGFHAHFAHPLVSLFTVPIFYFAKGIFASVRASSISILAIVGALNVTILFSLLKKITNNKKISLLSTLVYGFGFSTFVFATLFENYIFAAFFNLVLLFYMFLLKNTEKKLGNVEIFTLAILTIFSFGINLINVVNCLFIVVFLIFFKEEKNIKSFLKKFLKYIFVFIVLCVPLIYLQKISYGNDVFLESFRFENGKVSHKMVNSFKDTKTSTKKIKRVFQNNLVLPFYCLKLQTKKVKRFSFYRKDLNSIYTTRQKQEYHDNIAILKSDCKFSYCIFASIFLLLHLIFYIKQNKKIQNESIIKLLFLIVVLNILMNYFFDSNEGFLFSQNFFIFLVLMLGIVASNIKNKYIEYIWGLFVFFQICRNCCCLVKMKNIFYLNMANHCSFFRYILFAFVVTSFIVFLIYLFKKIIKKDLFLKSELSFTILSNMYLVYCVVFAVFAVLFAGRA